LANTWPPARRMQKRLKVSRLRKDVAFVCRFILCLPWLTPEDLYEQFHSSDLSRVGFLLAYVENVTVKGRASRKITEM